MALTYGELFAGIGGFGLAMERAGMSVLWQVEIDGAARSVLRRHWPDTTIHEDVRHVGRHNLEPVDLVCGGFPCQDISVAGRRAGLAGERSGLWWEFHRVVAELRPRWVLIENVPGLLSSNGGRDMGAVLGGLGQLGYGYAYAVLDAQFFGVPQRRRRVFIVGHSGDWGAPAQVLLEPEGVRGDSAPRRTTGESAAGPLSTGASSGGGFRQDLDGTTYVAGTVSAYPDPAYALAAGVGNRFGSGRDAQDTFVAATWDERNVTSRANRTRGEFGAPANTLHAEGLSVIIHALTSEGADASEDGTGRGTPPVAFTFESRVARNGRGAPSDVVPPLKAESGQTGKGDGAPLVAFYSTDGSHGVGNDVDRSPPLKVGSGLDTASHHAVAFTERSREGGRVVETQDDLAYALRNGTNDGHDKQRLLVPNTSPVLPPSMAVRRLTPVECARLQGFPDGWLDGLDLSDSTKYRQLGNAVCVNVVAWIARRIAAYEERT